MLKNNLYTLVKFLSLSIILLSPYSASSENLDDILNSPVLQGMDADNKMGSTKSNRDLFLDPDTNYASVFLQRDPVMLLDWLNHKDKPLRILKELVNQTDEYAYASRQYESNSKKTVTLEIYIPHPRYVELSAHNLLLELAKLEPPKLQIKFAEPFEINQIEGTVYHLADTSKNQVLITGQCSALVKFEKSSRINITGDCKDMGDIKKIISDLTFDRLKEKLNT